VSDISYTPPPPPPPPSAPQQPLPPPPAPPQGPTFDFGRPFTFVFEDPNWLTKILIGGLFYLAVFFLVGIFFILGYCARLTRNVIAGDPRPLPEWNDLGEYFSEGAVLFLVTFVYMIPIFALVGFFIVPAIIMAGLPHDSDVLRNLAGGVSSLVWCLTIPVSFALSLWLPGALLFTAVERRFSAGFEFARIWNFIRANVGNYLLAFVVYLVARFAGGFGVALCCIGVIFTAFWAFLVSTYAYAQAYRLATVR